MKGKGILVVLSGPSGAGKGTVLAEYFRGEPRTDLSVSATTRHPRPGERDGVDYHFITREEFEGMIARGEVVEYTCYNGNYYGTPAEPIRRSLEAGRDVILEIEVDGAAQVRRKFPEALTVFVLPPSFEELRRRLTGRGTETGEEVRARLETARKELALASQYDYILVNDRVEEAAAALGDIIRAAHCARRFNQELIDGILAGS